MARMRVHKCSVQSTTTRQYPSPLQAPVPASRGLPERTKEVPTMPTSPSMRSERTRDWTIRMRVVAGRPLYSSQNIDARMEKEPITVKIYRRLDCVSHRVEL